MNISITAINFSSVKSALHSTGVITSRACLKPRAAVNFLIHEGKYPVLLSIEEKGLRCRCFDNAKKTPLDYSAIGQLELLPENLLVLSQKKDRRSRGEYNLCTTKSIRARASSRRKRGKMGMRKRREKKTIGKIRRNCAPVDTPARIS